MAKPLGRRPVLAAGLALAVLLAAAGCGFRLRQPPRFAFTRLGVAEPASSLQRELQQQLRASGLELVAVGAAAPGGTGAPPEAVLTVLVDQRERAVVGSTAAGQVREFQLRVRFKFRLSTPAGKVLVDDSEILVQRDISYSETVALSKADEEAEMFRDMQADVVQQALRRLAAVKAL